MNSSLPFIFLIGTQFVVLGIVVWHLMRGNEHWWQMYERRMQRRGRTVKKSPNWERIVQRQRTVLLMLLAFVTLASLVGWGVVWNVVRSGS